MLEEKRGHGSRGQTSVEFITIFAMALLAFIIFFTLTQQQSVGVERARVGNDASNTVKSLAAAAEDVYSQGVGAKKEVFITIPDGYEPDVSSIGNESIRMRVAGNDYAESVGFDIYGYLPRAPGDYFIWVISEGNRVRIGTGMLTTDRTTINLIMLSNSTRGDSFNVISTWNESVNVTIAKIWDQNITMSLSPTAFRLAEGGASTVSVSFSAPPNLLGFYGGSLNITGTDAHGSTDSIILPVSVEVSTDKGIGPPLIVLPSIVNVSMGRNTSVIKDFQVCTNAVTSLTSVDFAPSTGAPGSWVSGYEPMGAFDAESCQTKKLTISVPGDTDLGNYSGFVYVTGNGPAGAADTISLAIRVVGLPYDVVGPNVTNITIYPNTRRIYVQDPVSIKVTGDDSKTGNDTVIGCEASVDNGAWYQLVPTDGTWNKQRENASYTWFSGFSQGNHSVRARCTDIKNNTGPIANATFRVFKEFLFVTAGGSPNGNESAWLSWIAGDHTFEGYAWNYDAINSTAFIAGPSNLNFYTTVMAEEYSSGMKDRLMSFESSGGSVVLLGNALTEAPKDLGCSNKPSNPTETETRMSVRDNTNYITSDLPLGTITVENNSTVHGRIYKDVSTILVDSYLDPSHFGELAICPPRYYFWAPVTPVNFNEVGLNLTGRTFDYAINASTLR